jgi:hypothetical protein
MLFHEARDGLLFWLTILFREFLYDHLDAFGQSRTWQHQTDGDGRTFGQFCTPPRAR